MVINHNMQAANALRNSGANQANAAKSMEKLSSGLRINRAGDDAAGLSISEKMRAQIRGLEQASTNAQDGISMIQTAEGALNETHNILQRMRELSVQAGNDTNADTDRTAIQEEINQLTSEINRIGNTTEFNTQKLINGDKSNIKDRARITNNPTPTIGTPGSMNANEIDGKVKVSGTYTGAADGKMQIIGTRGADGNTTWKYSVDNGTTKVAIDNSGKFTKDGVEYDVSKIKVENLQNKGSDITFSINLKAQEAKKTDDTVKLQIGANENQSMSVEISDMRADALGLTGNAGDDGFTKANGVTDGTSAANVEAALDVSTAETAANAVTKINDAIEKVSSQRSKLGAIQNRLEYTISNLDNSSENLTSAESRIRDVNMAKEMSTFSKNNILQQAAQAMLSQANQQPQNVLQLLR